MTEKKAAVGYLKKTVYSISDRSHRIPELFITSLRRAVCVGVELYFVFRLCEGKRKKKKKNLHIYSNLQSYLRPDSYQHETQAAVFYKAQINSGLKICLGSILKGKQNLKNSSPGIIVNLNS